MKTLNISDETYSLIKAQLSVSEQAMAPALINLSKIDDMVGKSFFFRTVTYHLVGRVKKVLEK